MRSKFEIEMEEERLREEAKRETDDFFRRFFKVQPGTMAAHIQEKADMMEEISHFLH